MAMNALVGNPTSTTPPADTVSLSYLALGDSYTIGESVSPADRYPVLALKDICHTNHFLYKEPDIIATTGWTTGNLLDAIAATKPSPSYQLVTLLIGVNNQFQGRSREEYREQFALLLKESITLAGNDPSHVLVLSIPDYSVTPFGRSTGNAPRIAAQIDSFNADNHRLSLEYKVNYLDVTAESRKAAVDATLIASDGLHFSAKEYAIWARMMEPVLKEILHPLTASSPVSAARSRLSP